MHLSRSPPVACDRRRQRTRSLTPWPIPSPRPSSWRRGASLRPFVRSIQGYRYGDSRPGSIEDSRRPISRSSSVSRSPLTSSRTLIAAKPPGRFAPSSPGCTPSTPSSATTWQPVRHLVANDSRRRPSPVRPAAQSPWRTRSSISRTLAGPGAVARRSPSRAQLAGTTPALETFSARASTSIARRAPSCRGRGGSFTATTATSM